ncbi:MAG: hypothetical protein NWS46_07515, partial [Cyclobacteriaceae bacterium]|nr:hypothetical protein [Cyclobacteriaceae bacterium]
MKLVNIILMMTAFVVVSCSQTVEPMQDGSNKEKLTNLVDFANPLMGTDSEFSLSNGYTYPAIAQPWG